MDSATINDNRFAYDVTQERSNRLENISSEESSERDSESETTIDDDHDDSDDSDDDESVKNISPE